MNETAITGTGVVPLGVAGLERSERFYVEVLGLEHARPPKGVIYFELAGLRPALLPRDALARHAGVEPTPPDGFGGMTLSCNVAGRSGNPRRLGCGRQRSPPPSR